MLLAAAVQATQPDAGMPADVPCAAAFQIPRAGSGPGPAEGERAAHHVDQWEALLMLSFSGAAGRCAGPSVLPLLDDQDWSVRLLAVRALASIGYQLASAPLIDLLADPHDLRLTGLTAWALGQLRAQSARPALQRLAKSHWFLPVRREATRALAQLGTGPTPPDLSPDDARALESEFFGLPFEGVTSCQSPLAERSDEPAALKLRPDRSADELRKLAYTAVVYSDGAADPSIKRDGITEVDADTAVEHRDERRQTPQMALRTKDGWLAGTDRGEWIGELVFVADRGGTQTILRANIEDIYLLGRRLVAVTGLAHGMMSAAEARAGSGAAVQTREPRRGRPQHARGRASTLARCSSRRRPVRDRQRPGTAPEPAD